MDWYRWRASALESAGSGPVGFRFGGAQWLHFVDCAMGDAVQTQWYSVVFLGRTPRAARRRLTRMGSATPAGASRESERHRRHRNLGSKRISETVSRRAHILHSVPLWAQTIPRCKAHHRFTRGALFVLRSNERTQRRGFVAVSI